jgi:hypothetical protein
MAIWGNRLNICGQGGIFVREEWTLVWWVAGRIENIITIPSIIV